jgi:hypothetical protein
MDIPGTISQPGVAFDGLFASRLLALLHKLPPSRHDGHVYRTMNFGDIAMSVLVSNAKTGPIFGRR